MFKPFFRLTAPLVALLTAPVFAAPVAETPSPYSSPVTTERLLPIIPACRDVATQMMASDSEVTKQVRRLRAKSIEWISENVTHPVGDGHGMERVDERSSL